MTNHDPGPMDPGDPIVTRRLSLEVIPDEVLTAAAMRTGDEVEWPGVGPILVELCSTMPASIRLRQAEADPAVAAWLIRGIVVDDPSTPTGRRVVGHLGGHDRPGPDGTVEIGYTVAAADRGRGIASEAARAWFAWAHRLGARRARLSTTEDNVASLAIAARLGLEPVGRLWDDDDQVWEVVHEAGLPLGATPASP